LQQGTCIANREENQDDLPPGFAQFGNQRFVVIPFLLKFGSASEVGTEAYLDDDYSAFRAVVCGGVWEEHIAYAMYHYYIWCNTSGYLSEGVRNVPREEPLRQSAGGGDREVRGHVEAVQCEFECGGVEAHIRASCVCAACDIIKVNLSPLGEDGLLEVE
jgi:hypothetical protein